MNTFPPISGKRASSEMNASASKRASRGSSIFTPGTLAYADEEPDALVPTADDAAVHVSRARAIRVRGAYRETDTVSSMIQRVRGQFLRGPLDTATSTQLPLIFPPALPSRLRPEQPRTADFSQGIRLLKTLRRGGSQAEETVEAAAVSAAIRRGSETSSIATATTTVTAPRRASEITLAGDPNEDTAAASAAPASEAEEVAWGVSPSRYFTVPSSSEAATERASGAVARAVAPMHALPSWDAQYAQLLDLELCARQRLEATEAWDRQVTCEMMMVHYVTFVLKPETEELLSSERVARGVVRFEEEKARYDLCQASELAAAIREGVRATRAREAKLARLERVDAQVSKVHASPATTRDDDQAEDARAIMRRYVEMRHGPAIRATAAEGTKASTPRTVRTPTPPAPSVFPHTGTSEALRSAAARAKGYAKGATLSPEMTLRDTAATQAARRCSGLVLPPIFGAGRTAPRRNTLGVARYMALLDEDAERRAAITQTEAELRADMLALARSEWNALRGWQHKRLHLERLRYWREAREQREQQELEGLTDVGSKAALAARHARETAARALGDLIMAEEEQRDSVHEEERAAQAHLVTAAQRVAAARFAESLCESHEAVARAVFTELLQIQATTTAASTPLPGVEAVCRQGVEGAYEAWVTTVAALRHDVLLWLYTVSLSEDAMSAVAVLQRAFRLSLRGHYGWRTTHQRIGEDIRRLRATQSLHHGRAQLRELQAALQQEETALADEIAAEHIAAQRTLMNEEFNHRLAMASQEGWTYSTLQRQYVEELIRDIVKPRIARCLRDEEHDRLQLVVEEEIRRGQLGEWFGSLCAVLGAKTALVQEESRVRQAVAQEESYAFHHLQCTAEDDREDIRLAERAARMAEWEQRETFVCRVEDETSVLGALLLRAHVDLGLRARLQLLAEEAVDPTWHAALAYDEATQREVLQAEFTAAVAQTARAEAEARAIEDSFAHRAAALADAETHGRTALREMESSQWHQLVEVDFQNTPNGQRIRTVQQQRQAVRVLSEGYVATRDHVLGRTATLRYLHDAFAVRRELAELRAIRSRQRAHVRATEQQLEEQLAEERADAQEACQFLLDVLVERSEPRERSALRDTEAFLRQLIFDNFFRHAEGADRQEEAPTMAQRIDRELVMRQEARERAALEEQYEEVFQRYFEERKADAVADAQARRIQRAWRTYQQQRRLATQGTLDVVEQLREEELAVRWAMAREELETRATTLELPAVSALAQLCMTQEVFPAVLYGVSTLVGRATIEEEEFAERLDVLWEQRYALCDDVLCAEEARARHRLVARAHACGMEQAQLQATEALQRTLLTRERTLFLLRILAKEEAAHRQKRLEEAHIAELEAMMEREVAERPSVSNTAPSSVPYDEL